MVPIETQEMTQFVYNFVDNYYSIIFTDYSIQTKPTLQFNIPLNNVATEDIFSNVLFVTKFFRKGNQLRSCTRDLFYISV